MSTTSGWRYEQPGDDVRRHPADHTGEPIGYNLGDLPVYEQPPVRLAAYAVAPVSNRQAIAGFAWGLVGLVAAAFVSVFSLPLPLVGLFVSREALRACRRGEASGRGLAKAGIVLGAVDIVVALVAAVFLFAPGS
jgi:hypothetical protein